MSGLSTLASRPGTVARRSPGNRIQSRVSRWIGVVGARAKYLVPPVLALTLVVGVQLYNSVQPRGASEPAVGALEPRVPGAVDPVPVTDIAPVGAVDTSDTDRRIEFWRDRADAHPQSEQEWIYIGDLFDLKGRQTGDISEFVAAQDAYDKAAQIAPYSASALAGKARIRATLHDFQGAVDAATLVLQLDPAANDALAVVFDASVELGDLANARLALDQLAARANSPTVTIREAKLAFLDGDAASAADEARQAAISAAGNGAGGASVAFFQYSAAEYALLAGQLDEAADAYAASLKALPGYPLAIYGQARLAYARGETSDALALAESAAAAIPRPDVLAFLGDLYAQSGELAKAADQYATVDFIADIAAQSAGAVYDREYALYLADHGLNVARALELAQAELAARHDVYAYDTLAWALHANGRDSEALEASRQALAMGTVDAKLLIHAGLIEIANGLSSEGRAHIQSGLELTPAFSPLVRIGPRGAPMKALLPRRLTLGLAISLAALALAAPAASAHPLGNFTINHYSGIRAELSALVVDQVTDYAEVPTFTERRAMDKDADGEVSAAEAAAFQATACASIGAQLDLSMGGERLPLTNTHRGLSFPMGQGSLTMRLVCVYRAALDTSLSGTAAFSFSDRSYAERRGWREIVVQGDQTTISAIECSVGQHLGKADCLPR